MLLPASTMPVHHSLLYCCLLQYLHLLSGLLRHVSWLGRESSLSLRFKIMGSHMPCGTNFFDLNMRDALLYSGRPSLNWSSALPQRIIISDKHSVTKLSGMAQGDHICRWLLIMLGDSIDHTQRSYLDSDHTHRGVTLANSNQSKLQVLTDHTCRWVQSNCICRSKVILQALRDHILRLTCPRADYLLWTQCSCMQSTPTPGKHRMKKDKHHLIRLKCAMLHAHASSVC